MGPRVSGFWLPVNFADEVSQRPRMSYVSGVGAAQSVFERATQARPKQVRVWLPFRCHDGAMALVTGAGHRLRHQEQVWLDPPQGSGYLLRRRVHGGVSHGVDRHHRIRALLVYKWRALAWTVTPATLTTGYGGGGNTGRP